MDRFRFAVPEDAAAIAAIYAPFVSGTHVSFEEVAPTPAAFTETIARAAGLWPWVVCETGGAVAGYAYAGPHRSRAGYRFSVDVSAYVGERERGRGVGSGLYGALLELLAAQRYRNAFAGIALPNAASVALHRACGFVEIARYRNVGFKAGAWHDTLWLQRALGDYPTPPPEPLALRDLEPARVAAAFERERR